MHNIVIEMWNARHGDMRYSLTLDDEYVYEDMDLAGMLATLFAWLNDPEGGEEEE